MRWRRRQREEHLEREIRSDLELEAAEQEGLGLSAEQAREAAQRAFGNTMLVKEDMREVWSATWFERLAQDARYGWRNLRKNPSFAITSVLSLALGIGANAAMFTVVDAVLLKLLPVREPQELMLIGVRAPERSEPGFGLPYPLYELLRDQNHVFSSMLAYAPVRLNVSHSGQTQPVNGELVSGSFFESLGVAAVRGRRLTGNDDSGSAPPAAVISYNFWQAQMGASPDVIGRSITVNAVPFTIVGVAPPAFPGLEPGTAAHIYVPIHMEPRLNPASDLLRLRTNWWLRIMGRLRNGVSETAVQANLDQLGPLFLRAAMAEAPPNVSDSMKAAFLRQRFIAEPGSKGVSNLRRQYSRPLLMLMAVVGLVLLITCANLANLLLSRSVARGREIALRVALGASRRRVVRQLLTESVVLGALGGMTGLALAELAIQFLPNALDGISIDLHLNARVVLFTASVSLLTSVAFGILPAVRASQTEILPDLKFSVRNSGSFPMRLIAGRYLSVFQVAVCILLVVGAGLFIRTFQNLASVDLGFRRDRILIVPVNPAGSGYTGPRLARLYQNVADRLRLVPGVTSVSFSMSSPLSGNDSTTMISAFGTTSAVHEASRAHRNVISPGFFHTVGIDLVAGREFDERDGETGPKVAIVNETFARHLAGSGPPLVLGKSLGYGPGQSSGPVTIVGVVRDSKYNNLREQQVPMVYLPYRQFPATSEMTFEVQTSIEPAALAGTVRAEIGGHVTVGVITTIEREIDGALRQERLLATLVSVFGLLSLFLAIVGLFGVVNYSVTRRTNEIGIRMALGARPIQVMHMAMKEAVLVVVAGLAIGIPAALAGGRLIASLLFGVMPNDPFSLLTGTAVFIAAALIAAWLPARRASAVDPLMALRHE
jgi:predicted permease